MIARMTTLVAIFAMIAVPALAQAPAAHVPAPIAGVGIPALIVAAIGFIAHQRLKRRG
jgi:hypothetical protein